MTGCEQLDQLTACWVQAELASADSALQSTFHEVQLHRYTTAIQAVMPQLQGKSSGQICAWAGLAMLQDVLHYGWCRGDCWPREAACKVGETGCWSKLWSASPEVHDRSCCEPGLCHLICIGLAWKEGQRRTGCRKEHCCSFLCSFL